MVVGLLGGFKKEDNFLGLGVFLVGLKRRDIRLGEMGSETSEAAGSAVATKRPKGGMPMVAMVKKGNVCAPCECGEAAIWPHS